jgi:hypothetical protein
MINSPNNGLDEFVKQSLENHRVPFNEAHWKEFESKLGSQPRVNPFSKWNFSLNTIIGGIVILSASVFIYAMSNRTSPEQNKTVSNPTTLTTVSTTVKKETVPAPVVNTNTSTASNETPVNNVNVDPFMFSVHSSSTYSFFTSNDLSNSEGTAETTNPVEKPNGFSFTSTNNNTITNVSSSNDDKLDPKELQDALKDSGPTVINNNIFPDQIDPLKGVVKSTKETDTMISKANNLPDNNDPLIMIGKDGKIISNTGEVIKTVKMGENKSDTSKTETPKGKE